ncbi:MAG TPA: ATP-binding protein [Ramlibacter sp.]|nr:ATP-binding protein [Ramlibacter sp.]
MLTPAGVPEAAEAEWLLGLVVGHAIFRVDALGRMASWNEGVRRVFGWERGPWLELSLDAIFAPEDGASVAPLAGLRSGAGDLEQRRTLVRRDGTRLVAACRLAAVPGAGAQEGHALVCREIGAELRAEQRSSRLLEQERAARGDADREAAALATALEAIPDAVYIGTAQGITRCNTRALEMLGASSIEDLRARIEELARRFQVRRERNGPLVPPQELPFVRALNGEPAVLETWATRPDGEHVFIRGTAAPIRVDGQVIGAVAVNGDLTARWQLEEAARAAREQAERASRVKDEFLAIVSHELRTPLSAIVGWATLLQRTVADPPPMLGKGLAAIMRNAQLQSRLVDDLLDVTRIQSGRLRLELQPLDLTEVVAAAFESVLPLAQAQEVRMEIDADAAGAVVHGDAGRLQQVAWNLLSNAVKFTPAGGSVAISLRPGAGEVVLQVSDTGQGIDPDFLPHVFDRFRQEDATVTRRHGGLGLGLAIVRELVELHRGTVRAESRGLGRGARFTVTLPLGTAGRAG